MNGDLNNIIEVVKEVTGVDPRVTEVFLNLSKYIFTLLNL